MREFLTSVNYHGWVLPALLVIPLVGALLILAHGVLSRGDDTIATAGAERWIALLTFVVEFLVSLGLWWTYDPSSTAWQAVVDTPWIAPWGAHFQVGIDGI